MKTLSTQAMIGQRLVTGFPGPEMSDEFQAAVRDYKIGNVILFRENIKSLPQLKKLCADIQAFVTAETGYPAFITIDQEGGVVTRLPSEAVNVPSPMSISASGVPQNAYQAGSLTGQQLRDVGVNFNLAPSVDVNCNPKNPVIGVRSYGDDPKAVALYAENMVKGLMAGGVLPCIKHFPGHGDTSQDSHLSLPCVDKTRQQLEETELYPYRALVAAGVPAVMTTHILFPALDDSGLPATMSKTILQGLLRQEMGFRGLILSDCMQMQAIAAKFGTKNGVLTALAAGVDLVFVSHDAPLCGEIAAAALEIAQAGTLPLENLTDSVERILSFKAEWAYRVPSVEFSLPAARAEAARLLEAGVTAVNAVPFTLGESPLCIGPRAYRVALIGNVVDDLNPAFPEQLAPLLGGAAAVCEVEPNEREIGALVALAKRHSSVICCTYNGHLRPGQMALLAALAQSGVPMAAVALRNPYDLAGLPKSVLALAVYEYSAGAADAVAPVLRGERSATGVLPVCI